MSITDELREWFKDRLFMGNGYAELTAIADRIDAEHDKALNSVDDAYDSGYNVGYDEGFASADDWLAQHEDAMAEHGWIRLPKDADGVPVRVGDELCNYTLSGYPYPNGGVYCKAIVNERMVLVGQKDSSFKDLLMWEARWCHHYHAPTVEDVLTEFGIDWEHESDCEDRAALLKEYAAKLRLAEGEDV